MIPLFSSDTVWRKYEEELLSWLKTPYRHLQNVKGRGADCTQFIAQAMKNVGILTDVVYDYYPRDWHLHTDTEFVLESCERHIREYLREDVAAMDLTKDDDLMRGDMITFSTTKKNVSNHCAVVLDENFGRLHAIIHSINHRGVSKFPLGKRWRKKQRKGLRFMVR